MASKNPAMKYNIVSIRQAHAPIHGSVFSYVCNTRWQFYFAFFTALLKWMLKQIYFRYRDNVSELSRLMRLHQEGRHPMDETVWLLQFLSKTKGATHLRLESRNLNFVQYHCIDVMAFLLVACFVIYKLIKLTCCRRRRKTKSKTE